MLTEYLRLFSTRKFIKHSNEIINYFTKAFVENTENAPYILQMAFFRSFEIGNLAAIFNILVLLKDLPYDVNADNTIKNNIVATAINSGVIPIIRLGLICLDAWGIGSEVPTDNVD